MGGPTTAVAHTDKSGAFQRKISAHRHIISQSNPTYLPEANRYHLHIALACPWACGVLCVLHLKGLENVISYSIVHPTWDKTKPDDDEDAHHGWVYRSLDDAPMSNPLGHGSFPSDELCQPDTITNVKTIRELYNLCGDDVGPFTTPVLYDKKTKTIVSNESTEIMRMINDAFNDLAEKPKVDLYPSDVAEELQKLNDETIYPKVNNGVYRCGFAISQKPYDEAVTQLFDSLDMLEDKLSKQRYLGGNTFTWLDLRLFMTLVRFDPVYITYFKANTKRLVEYPNLLGFVRDVYSIPEVKKWISMRHIKVHYFSSHVELNKYAILPAYNGPDLEVASGREEMSSDS